MKNIVAMDKFVSDTTNLLELKQGMHNQVSHSDSCESSFTVGYRKKNSSESIYIKILHITLF